MENKIISLMKKHYNYGDFYKIVWSKINKNDNINSNYSFKPQIDCSENINKLNSADFKVMSRVDLPIFFGNYKDSKYRIMIFGREPRDTDDKFNINIIGENIFGTPFGIEFWDEKNKYYKAFKNIINNKTICCYFSDIVKEYKLVGKKRENDIEAKSKFKIKAIKYLNLLNEEIIEFNPTHIIGLGRDSYNFLKSNINFNMNEIIYIRHPSYGGHVDAYNQINELISKLNC